MKTSLFKSETTGQKPPDIAEHFVKTPCSAETQFHTVMENNKLVQI